MKKTLLSIFFLIVGFSTTAIFAEGHSHQNHSKHGFLLVGEQDHFLYHLSKYNSPHRYLAIFKVRVFSGETELSSLPNTARVTLSALSSDTFALAELGNGSRKEISAELFDGYLRSKDKDSLGTNYKIKIDQIIHFEEIFAEHGPASELSYIGFGSSSDFYFAHHIGGAPNYEQLIKVKIIEGLVPFNGASIRFPQLSDRQPLAIGSAGIIGEYDAYILRKIKINAEVEYLLADVQNAVPNQFAKAGEKPESFVCRNNGVGYVITGTKQRGRLQSAVLTHFDGKNYNAVADMQVCRNHKSESINGNGVVGSCNNVDWQDRYNVEFVVNGNRADRAEISFNEKPLVTLKCKRF